ncbi:septum formation initiator family protein [Blochmannia endosymbiont of Polyrhachis (Hedomyrma) turneri]|uniref:septum formation initiator family protein n=1 Tax=Blochmannia endosymbiont of Polyrhachis (Hedomyrma) turneri TaxID=1505596 RepID=UPI00061A6259|nr:septum formation initiator family protein [Blochmannia endosymbiont of Polyrhachis (Hedomyrma) turneri]AKC59749.1 Cell division protein FtsB [Blochmannia endosymbiont of Polyrhachis (Hedomyrma) turneri]
MKCLVFTLMVILFWLQYVFWFGKHGVCDFFCIKNTLKIKFFNNSRYELKIRNSQLLFEIDDLISHRNESVEERARHELGMIKSDECFYRLIPLDRGE